MSHQQSRKSEQPSSDSHANVRFPPIPDIRDNAHCYGMTFEKARIYSILLLSLLIIGTVLVFVFADLRYILASTVLSASGFLILQTICRCPACGKSLFTRGGVTSSDPLSLLTTRYVPWPEQTCSRCGFDLLAEKR